MDKTRLFLAILIALEALPFFTIIPAHYKLGFKDNWKLLTNRRYSLFVFVHKRFDKVRDGNQQYYRYAEEIKAVYDKDNYSDQKSEHDNRETRYNFSILWHILDDEPFFRKYFSGTKFTYANYQLMMTEWDMRPEIEAVVCGDDREFLNSYHKLTKEERLEAGSFKKLIIDASMIVPVMDVVENILATINTGEEYEALYLALKDFRYVQFANMIEWFDCTQASFRNQIKKGYTALSSQHSKYNDSSIRDENVMKINELRDGYLKELNSIKK